MLSSAFSLRYSKAISILSMVVVNLIEIEFGWMDTTIGSRSNNNNGPLPLG